MKKLSIMLAVFLVMGAQSVSAQSIEYMPPSGGYSFGTVHYIQQSTGRLYNLPIGATAPLTILAHTDKGDFDVTPQVRIYAEDETIISIDNEGLVITITALKSGETNIHAEFAGVSADIPVIVYTDDAVLDTGNVYKNMDPSVLAEKRQASLNIINEIRGTLGIAPLQLHDQLNQAAQAHSNYLQWNGGTTNNAHYELRSDMGFTGSGPDDRAGAFGYPSFSSVGEVISFTGDPVEDTLSLIDAPLHRTLLLSPDFRDVGIGVSDNTVINPAVTNLDHPDTKRIYYPYHRQTDVPAAWFAAEEPNPLAPFGREYTDVGYPISINTGAMTLLTLDRGTITDPDGNPVDYFKLDESVSNFASGSIYLIPKQPLKQGTTYTVSVSYKAEDIFTGEVTNESNTWSFTTEPDRDEVVELTAEEDQLSAELGKPFKLSKFTATYESGRVEDVTQLVKFSYDPNVMEIKDGLVTVKNAELDDYVLFEAEYEKVHEYMTIHIWDPADAIGAESEMDDEAGDDEAEEDAAEEDAEEADAQLWEAILGEPANPVSQRTEPVETAEPIKTFSDITGHWAEQTIRWAQQNQVSKGYPDGTFRPNDNVNEAEFLAMLFNLYGADGDSTLKESILDKRSAQLESDLLPAVSERWDTKFYLYAWGLNLGFLGGMQEPAARLAPIDRYMAAQIIAGVDGQNLSQEEAVQYLLANNYSGGKTSATVAGYEGDDLLTRSEALQFLRNIKERGLESLKERPQLSTGN